MMTVAQGCPGLKLTITVWFMGEQAGLIGAKTDCRRCAVFEEGHECDLNRPSCPIQDTADLDRADRALNCGPCLDRAANEYIAATNRGQEK